MDHSREIACRSSSTARRAPRRGRRRSADWTPRRSGSTTPTGCSPRPRACASPGHARITLPATEGGYGRAVDGLEGFARTFLLAGFRIAGERGAGLDDLADCYAAASPPAPTRTPPERWVRLDEHAQAKVEAASIALILDMTRPVDLGPARRRDARSASSTTSPRPSATTPTRRSTGSGSASSCRPSCARSAARGRPRTSPTTSPRTTRSSRADGWMSDGSERSYDHYVGWALHLYPVLWARMQGAADLAAGRDRGATSPRSTASCSTPSPWSAPTARR